MKIKLSNLPKEMQKKLESAMNELTKPKFLNEIGQQIVEDIYKRTKLGYGIEEPRGTQSKLKPLTGQYKKMRKSFPKLSTDTSPSKSNLSLTGDMLNDLKVKVTNTKALIYLGSEFSKNKAKWNSEKGRTFLNVSNTQVSKIIALLKNKLKELLK